jgi:hypothetical protein
VGDVNGDGYADVLVADQVAGAVYIFNSAGAAGVPSATYTAANATLTGVGGSSVAFSDTNGDGYADVLIGTRGVAKVYLFHSAGATGVANGAYSAANTTLSGAADSNFGYSVALIDPVASPGAPLLAALVRRRRPGTLDQV